jgi:hypothetical protein
MRYILFSVLLLLTSCSDRIKEKNFAEPIEFEVTSDSTTISSSEDSAYHVGDTFVDELVDRNEVVEENIFADEAIEEPEEQPTPNTSSNKGYSPKKSTSPPSQQSDDTSIQEGYLKWVTPKEVGWGEEFLVHAYIAEDTLVVTSFDSRKEIIKKVSVPITQTMDIIMTCSPLDAIEIHQVVHSQQAILDGEVTHWEWQCKAKKIGDAHLKLVVSRITQNGKKVSVLEESLVVKIRPVNMFKSFMHNNWQWLIGVILIPLLIFVAKRKKKDI